MRQIRKRNISLSLPTLKLEGGLFLPDMLEKAALGLAKFQTEADYGIPKGLKTKDEFSRSFLIASLLCRRQPGHQVGGVTFTFS